jgi:hypothetical protein
VSIPEFFPNFKIFLDPKTWQQPKTLLGGTNPKENDEVAYQFLSFYEK